MAIPTLPTQSMQKFIGQMQVHIHGGPRRLWLPDLSNCDALLRSTDAMNEVCEFIKL